MANMSHEIRTPLNGILGFTSLLTAEELPPPDKRRDYAAIINRSADSLTQLINDILDISKMDAGQLTIEQREFNLLHTLNSLRSEEHTSELQSRPHLVCRLLLEKK